MTDTEVFPESHILTSTPELKSLIDGYGLEFEPDPQSSQQNFIKNEEHGFFKIRANGHYLISSYLCGKDANSRTYRNDRIADFIEVTKKLHDEYLGRKAVILENS